MTETPSTCDVLPARALDHALSYDSNGLTLSVGQWVHIPLGSGTTLGLVTATESETPRQNLKPVSGLVDLPPLSPSTLDFLEHMARYTLANRGLILRLVTAGAGAALSLKPERWLIRGDAKPATLTRQRARVLAAFDDCPQWRSSELSAQAGVSPGVIKALVTEGVLTPDYRPPASLTLPNPDYALPTLTAEQAAIARDLSARDKGFSVSLLEGVTGSGKTEVYFTLIAEKLRHSQDQILVMMPEIALTEAFIKRFRDRFGCEPGVWHSGVSEGARGRLYRDVADGQARVVLGARSALFLPFASLGLIVIDEEHDSSYKSEDRVVHHARDMAILRARYEAFPVLLCSATPSLETWQNVKAGRYHHFVLRGRFASGVLPSISLIDLRRDPPDEGRWISPPLEKAVSFTLAHGGQALLFLNRRGYAPLTLCRSCGFRFGCPTCTSWLVEHKHQNRLCCHHCGYSQPKPDLCPQCQEDNLIAWGPGIERIAEEAQHLFPEARMITLSSDSKANQLSLQAKFEAIISGKVNLIIGTQLIAKGHHFPHLDLVGVIDGDLGLAQADLRAAERSFQLLTQVVGRAGRERQGGQGLLQTLAPEHPVLQAFVSGNQQSFYEKELEERQRFGWPPVGRLAALIISSKCQKQAEEEARRLARNFPKTENVTLLGPVEAPLARLRGAYRYRLLIKTSRNINHSQIIRQWLDRIGTLSSGTRLQIDIDPVSFS